MTSLLGGLYGRRHRRVNTTPAAPVFPARSWLFNVSPANTGLTTGNVVSTQPDATKFATTVSPGTGGTIKSWDNASGGPVSIEGGKYAQFDTKSGFNGVVRLPFDAITNNASMCMFHQIAVMPTQMDALFNARHSGGVLWKIALEAGGTGRVLVQNSANGTLAQSATGVYIPGMWNRFEWVADIALGKVSLNIYNVNDPIPANGTPIANTSAGSLGANPMATVDIGRPSLTTQDILHYFDAVNIWTGGITEAGPPAP